jgi:hypothetical protein
MGYFRRVVTFRERFIRTKKKVDVLVTLWETGCRPQELRKVEARHFVADRGRIWMFERGKSKGNRKR